jgi:phage baseplate assembly protein W
MAIVSSRKTDFSDLPLSFKVHPNRKDIMPLKDDEAIKQAVKVLILTNFGERPFRNNLGANITGLLFENVDPVIAITLRDLIVDLLNKREPRIELRQVFVKVDADNNRYDVTIIYKIVGIETEQEVSLYLNRIR